MKIRKYIVSIIMTGMAFGIQTAVLPALGVTRFGPELICIVLCVLAIKHDLMASALLGAAYGMFMDILFTGGIGMYALPYVLISAIATPIVKTFNDDNILCPVILTTVSLTVKNIIGFVIVYLSRDPVRITWGVFSRQLLVILISAALAVPVFMLMSRLYGKRKKEVGGRIRI